MNEKRFSWEYSYYDSTGEIYDWNRKECLMTNYLQKYEIEEWCQELNDLVEERNYFEKKKCEYFNECLMTNYLQKYEIEEWCQELMI